MPSDERQDELITQQRLQCAIYTLTMAFTPYILSTMR